MAPRLLGPRPTRSNDTVDIAWVTATYPSFSAYVVATTDLIIEYPDDPVDHTMLLVEVHAPNAQVAVSVPDGTLFTVGCQPHTIIPGARTGFFGFRYSAHAGTWFFLSATTQV